MSTAHSRRPDAREELDDDRAFERRLLWKGAIALLVVILVAWIRYRYFL